MNESQELDWVDKKILDMLTQDSRVSYAEISRQTYLSRAAIRRRVNSLMKRGVIENFSIVVNSAALGLNLAAFLEIEVQPNKMESVAQSLSEKDRVNIVYQMTGPTTLHVHAYCYDASDLARFLQEEVYSIPGVVAVTTQLLLRRYKSKLNIR